MAEDKYSNISKINREPSDDQKEAIERMTKMRRFLLADATGFGKTWEAVCSYGVLREKDASLYMVVFCPRAAIPAWRNELSSYTGFRFGIYTVEEKDREVVTGADVMGLDVLVMSYTAIEHFLGMLKDVFDSKRVVLVMDEADIVRNPKSQIGDVMRYIVSQAYVAWGMTATPLLNHLEDLYWIVDLLFPKYLGSFRDFKNYYTETRLKEVVRKSPAKPIPYGQKFVRNGVTYVKYNVKEIIGHKNLDHLRDRLKPVMLMRYTEFKLNFIERRVLPSAEDEALYLLAAKGILDLEYREFVGRLPDLQLAANNAVRAGREPNIDDLLSAKELKLLECISAVVGRGVGCIVYTGYHLSVDRLRFVLKHLEGRPGFKRMFELTGKTSTKAILGIQGGFSAGDVLLMTDAGGKSLNLQAADTVIFYDLPFSIGDLIQVIGRITRRDTKHEVLNVEFVVLDGTIDVYKTAYFLHNATLVNDVMGGSANIPKSVEKISKDVIISMRKELLWKTKKRT